MNVALITGGSRGLGRAIATSLAADGWEVVIDGRDADALNRAADDIGPRARAVAGNIADPAHRARLLETVTALGRLDVLINNAGTLGPSPLPRLRTLDTHALFDMMNVNVLAPLALTQAALPFLLASDGAVINVTSDAAVQGYEGWGAYGASKAALEQLSNVLAAEEPSIRVWWVDPGDMRTQMHQDAFPGEDISDRPEPETVVSAFQRLLRERPASGRVRASDLVVATA